MPWEKYAFYTVNLPKADCVVASWEAADGDVRVVADEATGGVSTEVAWDVVIGVVGDVSIGISSDDLFAEGSRGIVIGDVPAVGVYRNNINNAYLVLKTT